MAPKACISGTLLLAHSKWSLGLQRSKWLFRLALAKALEMAARSPWCRQGARNDRSGLRRWCQNARDWRSGTVLCYTGSKIALEMHSKLLFEEYLLGATKLCSITLCCALLVHGYAQDHISGVI